MRTPLAGLLAALLCAAAPASGADRGNWFSGTHAVGDVLVGELGRTRKTADLALYALKLPKATEAVLAALGRGVAVRLVVDAGHAAASEDVRRLAVAGAEVRTLKGYGDRGLMHNKIALLDGGRLITGSFNWTSAADNVNLENLLLRDEPALLAGFSAYWGWMWERADPLDGPARESAPRGPPPSDPAPSVWFKGQAWPSYAFSPQGGTEALLVKAIKLSTKRIDAAIFSFYGQVLADALIGAKARGVRVRLVLDRGQAANSRVVRALIDAGVQVRLRSGRGDVGVMHHKFALFDGELLETGSFNWSVNAETNSYENTVFSARPEDLSAFEDEFERAYGEASSS